MVAAYALLVLWIGAKASRRTDGVEGDSEWMLAGRSLSTGAVLASMVATELSAATFIGVPHAAYSGDWTYLQFAFGALLGKWIVSRTFIPHYHELGVETVYGFAGLRFGPRVQRASAGLFVCGRLLASGVRLYIAALALAVLTGVGLPATIVACALLAGTYTRLGGLRAVVWTDAAQAAVFLTAACGVLIAIGSGGEGGLPAAWEWAATGDRTRVFSLPGFDGLADFLSDGRSLWAALIGGCFLTLATHATDHDMVQRLLAAPDGRRGGRALLASAVLNLPLTLLFLSIGTGLAWFYANAEVAATPLGDGRSVLAFFARHELAVGARGLVFAGVFAAAMSSLDSAICAIVASMLRDLAPAKEHSRRRTRTASVWVTSGLVATALGMAAYAEHGLGGAINLVELALSAMTIVYGGLLGVFALGISTRTRGGEASALAGLASGAFVGALLFLQVPLFRALGWAETTVVAWPWWIPIAATIAFVVAAATRGEGA